MGKQTFTNELGNQIELSVVEKEINGVDGVFISIAGPISNTELHITKEETRKLKEELETALGD